RVVTEAKRLLLHTSHSIKEISVILGFESVGTFSRFFKNMTGENTSAYRKRLQ
ncbi:MAG: helix-turn-helix domain-containing protein, partial [Phocaeicola dorei]|nr:helix-turn-helix domain-containing protein [Phocaeicola dorei]